MSMRYRAEINGLRAIAVLAVIFFHAEFVIYSINPFSGGYVGVDVFFVISGYLITSIILKDLKENRFSFLKFYERRAKRILPALLTVILASIPFAWLYMLPKAMKEYAGSILSSLAFSSNFWFWQEDSYWAEPSALKPFLHTWSLSVEEQFYIVFPITLFLIWKLTPKYMRHVLIIGGLLSILFANFMTAKAPEFSFYLLPTRGWELLAGAILAKPELNVGRNCHSILNKVMPAFGIGLILYAVYSFDKNTKHPSFITIIPVLGTMLLLCYSDKKGIVNNILSNKIMTGIGIISYNLYLWHYPIFAFSRLKNSHPSYINKIECIFFSIILALLSYFLIEKPLRYGKFFSRRTFFFGFVWLFSLLATCARIYI